MGYTISLEDVWVGKVEDQVGGLADRLDKISRAGINLEFLISRRSPDEPGKGVVFLIPHPGDDMVKAAGQAGLTKWTTAASLRIEGPDRPQLLSIIVRALANENISVRGVSGATLGQLAVFQIAFDSLEDAELGSKTINALLNP
jgi:hypothetical protein